MLLEVKIQTNNAGQTYLVVWQAGGAHKIIPQPFDPFYYCKEKYSAAKVELAKKVLLSTQKPAIVYKYSFPSAPRAPWRRCLTTRKSRYCGACPRPLTYC